MANIPLNEQEAIAASLVGGNEGDVAVGLKLREFRDKFGVPRRLLTDVSGVSTTSYLRIENGRRGWSAHSLSTILSATHQIQRVLHPTRRWEYEKWQSEFIDLVAQNETRKRKERTDASDVHEQD